MLDNWGLGVFKLFITHGHLVPSSNWLTSHILAWTILTDDAVYRRSSAEEKLRADDAFTSSPSKPAKSNSSTTSTIDGQTVSPNPSPN